MATVATPAPAVHTAAELEARIRDAGFLPGAPLHLTAATQAIDERIVRRSKCRSCMQARPPLPAVPQAAIGSPARPSTALSPLARAAMGRNSKMRQLRIHDGRANGQGADQDTPAKRAERGRMATAQAALERAAAYPAHVLRVLDEIDAILRWDRLYLETHEVSPLFVEVCRVKRLSLEAARHALLMYLRRDPAA